MSERPDWDTYFLNIAEAVALRGDCQRARVGVVIVDPSQRIVATGYNGTPSGGASCLAGDCPRAVSGVPGNTPDYSNCIALHAEQNAVAYATWHQTRGGTAYLSGGKLPCDMCWKLLLAAGVVRIVSHRGALDANSQTPLPPSVP